MKTTLIVIQNEANHADAKKLIEKLMGSGDPQDRARMVAQARLVEAYERTQWPRRAPTLPVLLAYLMDQHSRRILLGHARRRRLTRRPRAY
jgi:HTH-type transcriptional regulator/antitoxin HigA